MSTTVAAAAPPPPEKANGLATYLKVIYAPAEAFATLGRVPTWGWAAIIGIILTLAGTFIGLPGNLHYQHIAVEQQMSQLPADQAAAQREALSKMQWIFAAGPIIGSVIGPWIGWLIIAAVFLLGAAFGGGQARFGAAWAAAVNVYLIPALAALINYIIVALRGPDSVNTMTDLFALPSLAMLVQGQPKLAAVLYSYNPFYIWYYIVCVVALEQTLKASRIAAIVTVIVLSLISAGLIAAFAK